MNNTATMYSINNTLHFTHIANKYGAHLNDLAYIADYIWR